MTPDRRHLIPQPPPGRRLSPRRAYAAVKLVLFLRHELAGKAFLNCKTYRRIQLATGLSRHEIDTAVDDAYDFNVVAIRMIGERGLQVIELLGQRMGREVAA